jgi:cardiolipin synthase
VSKVQWRDGNKVSILENGEEFFPRAYGAIAKAEREVLIETFIWFDDPVGRELRDVLAKIAARGVKVVVTTDGYGTPDLTADFVKPMVDAGVKIHLWDPKPKFMGMRTNLWRRLHRKLIVIDRKLAFVGGINFSEDHLLSYGEQAKQDYGVEVEGPIVADVYSVIADKPERITWPLSRLPDAPPRAGDMRAIFVNRDNEGFKTDIEWHYREAIKHARKEVIIANAYFFPGFRFIRALRDAARRGVKVKLILQGNPDKPEVRWATMTFYDYLLRAGVTIHEYCARPLHGKVAVVDDEWATVGSFNLDPLSMFLNLEANIIVKDKTFTADLRARLHKLIENDCKAYRNADAVPRSMLRQLLSYFLFHVSRRFPQYTGWLPAHSQRRTPLAKVLPEIAESSGGDAPTKKQKMAESV